MVRVNNERMVRVKLLPFAVSCFPEESLPFSSTRQRTSVFRWLQSNSGGEMSFYGARNPISVGFSPQRMRKCWERKTWKCKQSEVNFYGYEMYESDVVRNRWGKSGKGGKYNFPDSSSFHVQMATKSENVGKFGPVILRAFHSRIVCSLAFHPSVNSYQNQNIWRVYWKCVAPGKRTRKSSCHIQHPRNVEREILKVNVKSFSARIFLWICVIKSGKRPKTETQDILEAMAIEVQWIRCGFAAFPGHFNDFFLLFFTSKMKKVFEKRKFRAFVLVFVKFHLRMKMRKTALLQIVN